MTITQAQIEAAEAEFRNVSALGKGLTQCIKAALAAAERAAWQPIEMAEIGGKSRVLVSVPINHHRLVIAILTKDNIWLDEQLKPMPYPPNYWRPQPAPPKQTP